MVKGKHNSKFLNLKLKIICFNPYGVVFYSRLCTSYELARHDYYTLS